MKQKVKRNETSSSGNIIRTVLREELKSLATKDELKKFEQSVGRKFVSFESKMDFKLNNLEIKVDEKARQYRDEILNSNDRLAKRLEIMQQELELGNLQMRRQLEDHEQRITGLESAQKS